MADGHASARQSARIRPRLGMRPASARHPFDAASRPASALPDPASTSIEQVDHLQRTAGNAAVVQWLGKGRRRRPRRIGWATADDHAAPTLPAAQRDKSPQRDDSLKRDESLQRKDADDESSPEEEFLDDLDSGIAKAQEYLEYMPKALDYWKEVEGPMPSGLAEAAKDLVRISTQISAGLDKAGGVVKKAQELVQVKKWADSMVDVAQTTLALDLGDKASRDAWIASVDRLGKTSDAFVDAAGDWLKGLAIEGSLVASRAFIVLGALKAYAQIGWGAFKAGMKNVEAYINRFGFNGTEMRKVSKGEGSWTPPPEPDSPKAWTSAAEKKAAEKAFWRRAEKLQKADKRRARLAPYTAKVQKAEAAIADAKTQFDEKGFARAYRRRRDGLMFKVAHEMRYGKKKYAEKYPQGTAVRSSGALWWDRFTDSGAPFDETKDELGDAPAKKEHITLEEAQLEIDSFRRVDPTCSWFNDIYAAELEKFLGKARAALKAAQAEYATAAALAD